MNKRAILQLTLEGNLIREFESSKEAARYLGCEGSSICQSCKKEKPFRGFLWKYKTALPPRRSKIEILEEWNINLLQDLEDRIDELEDYYITSKIHQIIFNNDCINELLMQEEEQPKKKGHGRPPTQVDMFNKDGQFIKRFESIKQASEETKDPQDKIRGTLNGKLNLTPHGFYYTKVETDKKDKRDKNESEDETAADDLGFYIPRSKEDRKKMLFNYVSTRLENFYYQLPKKHQIQHKQFLARLIKSL